MFEMIVVFGRLLVVFVLSVECQGPAPPAPPAAEPPEPEGGECALNLAPGIQVCPDMASQGFADTSSIETVRFNESTAFVTGLLRFLKGLGEKTMVEILCKKESNGQYEVVFSHEICDFCSELDKPGGDYSCYFTQMSLPKTCPFDAGAYPINDLLADTSELPINSANAGSYLVTMNMYVDSDGTCKNSREFIACFIFKFNIECGA